jgi:hypothetical protein
MQARGRSLAVGALLACIGVVGALACSSSSSGATACNEAPWQCGTGQTCWPNCVCSSQPCPQTKCTLTFSCVQSDNAVPEGQNCTLSFGSGGAQCGDDQTCVLPEDAGANNGVCRQYCDQNRGCPSGESCVQLSVVNTQNPSSSAATEYVCVPPTLDQDAAFGIDTGGGGSSGSSSGGSYDVDAWYDGGLPEFDGAIDGNPSHQ